MQSGAKQYITESAPQNGAETSAVPRNEAHVAITDL